MKRRDFLKAATAGALLGSNVQVLRAAPGDAYRNPLVLVELKGGNDGLNTLVPYADPAYARLRPRIGIRREEVVQLTERAGLHPSLAPLLPLWEARELAVIQGVGYPQPNLSHFRSIEIWETASRSDQTLQEGWLTRAFRAAPVPSNFAADGIVIGSNDMGPLAGGARAVVLSNPEQFLRQARLAGGAAPSRNRALAHVMKVEGDVVQAARELQGGVALRTVFPQGEFGNAVRTAAQVLANPAGVAVLRLTLNGFDTHQNQAGTQANLLRQLAEGLVALKAALVELGRWDRTLVMTYAEFGRRPAENASGGTDHGTASVQFAMGGRVRGGLHGEMPGLDRLDGGNLVHTVDYRSLYASVLRDWWQADAAAAAGVLGGRWPQLELLRA
jgi:uncharacterized protein (DUF1501 family)